MALLTRLVHRHLRSSLRGRTRLTLELARRVAELQHVPVPIAGARPLFLDLRDPGNHELFRGAPYSRPPWEWVTAAALHQLTRPGDVVFDVGANRGLVAVVAAEMVGPGGRLVCFEPNPALLPSLECTAAATPWMSVLGVALSDDEGEASLFVGQNHEMGSLGDWVGARYGEATRRIPVVLHRLDRLVADGLVPRPDLLKIDVEGNELRVFRGARAVLDREDAPILIYEANLWAAPVATHEPATAVTDFLLALPRPGYRCYMMWDWGLVTRVLPGQILHSNLVAIPAARRSRWPALEREDFTELAAPSVEHT